MAPVTDSVRDVELTCEEDPSKAQASEDEEDETMSTEDATKERSEEPPPRRLVLLVMISVVQGYTLVGPLQHSFKVAMNIADTGAVGHTFTQAVAFVQWGKFAMTFGQNFVLSWLTPIQRVYLSMCMMFVGCLIPPVFVYLMQTQWIGVVFLAYALTGLSLGIYECNFLNVITPLGPLTKSWAIMGFPGAFAIINVVGFGLVSFGMPVQVLFWWIVCCIPVGVAIFYYTVPGAAVLSSRSNGVEAMSTATNTQATIWRSLAEWRRWALKLCPFMLANVVGHFVMEGALPANFNAYNAHYVPLFGPNENDFLMEKHRYFVVFFVFVGLGDTLSRRAGYSFKLDTYASNIGALIFGLVCCCIGMLLTTVGIAVVGWLSAFLAFWGQGFNYAVAAKYIDKFVPKEHNLAAYSLWMFAGGAGGILGSTMVDVIRSWICHGHSFQYECLGHL